MRSASLLFFIAPLWAAPLATYSLTAVNDPAIERRLKPNSAGPAVLRLQVLLDRAHFSSGEIDATYGKNLESAVTAYRAAHSLAPGNSVDKDVWRSLDEDTAPVLFSYKLSAEDVAGPFAPIPAQMEEKAKLPALPYENAAEKIGEKFHLSPSLLGRLNRGKKFEEAETEIVVPNVIVAAAAARKASKVVVNGTTHTVQALDTTGKLLASYPATVGSEHDPLPLGTWGVTGVQHNPTFFYNSDLFWDANEQHAKAKVPPGPNNPVGVVWIGLTKEHYGIHGTPEPGNIGHTESHGCIRLTNWDATDLSHMVGKGTQVVMEE
jgi:lipoprotein-anchoring transpeptidase ErfK/SrfK